MPSGCDEKPYTASACPKSGSIVLSGWTRRNELGLPNCGSGNKFCPNFSRSFSCEWRQGMANWRDTILKNFKPKISRLTLVADPDARAAYALIGAQPPPATGALRFRSELTGEAEPGGARCARHCRDGASRHSWLPVGDLRGQLPFRASRRTGTVSSGRRRLLRSSGNGERGALAPR